MNAFLSGLLRTVLIMSGTGSVIILLLLAIKPFIRHRLPKSAGYYFWLVALFALLVPISQVVTLPGRVQPMAPVSITAVVERNVVSAGESAQRYMDAGFSLPPAQPTPPMVSPAFEAITQPPQPALPPPPTSFFPRATTVMMLAYAPVTLLVLLVNLVGYLRFGRKLRKSAVPAHSAEVDMLQKLTKGRSTPRIFRSGLAATPMLVGLFCPAIVLPMREYTPAHLRSILLHELTHLRRLDIAVKWASLLACALHWFNPLVWLARREIDRTCELSCDEVVTRHMDAADKKAYGNTLLDLSVDEKLPRTVLSTTMCTEKRALKERLTTIMKGKRHTKRTIFVSMMIALVAVLAACALGAGRGDEADEATIDTPTPAIITEPDEVTDTASDTIDHLFPTFPVFMNREFVGESRIRDLISPTFSREVDTNDAALIAAFEYMGAVAYTLHPNPNVQVVEGRIDVFEPIAALPGILPGATAVELWRLDFALQVEEDGDDVRWGTFTPDENGWISQATAFNDARTILAFVRYENGDLTLHGAIPWWMEYGEVDTPWAAEITARTFFEAEGMLSPRTFEGNHYFVDFRLGNTGQGRLLLSQPITQGDGGIWVVERWHMLSSPPPEGPFYHAPPQSDTLLMLEYYAALQAAFDAGEQPGLANPETVARAFLDEEGWNEAYAPITSVVQVHFQSGGFTSISPIGDPNVPFTRSNYWPDMVFDEQRVAERARVMADIGGLAFNEAYQFHMEDGNFGVITGWRPFDSLADLQQYFPEFDLPQRIGDFSLVSISVNNDRLLGGVGVYINPHPAEPYSLMGHTRGDAPIPINEIYTRDLIPISAFYAIYVNSLGEYVGLGVTMPIMAFSSATFEWDDTPFSTLDMGPNGEIFFVGEHDAYKTAIWGEVDHWVELELSILTAPVQPDRYAGWSAVTAFEGMLLQPLRAPVPRQRLEDIVSIFNPAALFAAYQWELMSFQ